MSTLSIRLPDSLHKQVKQIAKGEGVAIISSRYDFSCRVSYAPKFKEQLW